MELYSGQSLSEVRNGEHEWNRIRKNLRRGFTVHSRYASPHGYAGKQGLIQTKKREVLWGHPKARTGSMHGATPSCPRTSTQGFLMPIVLQSSGGSSTSLVRQHFMGHQITVWNLIRFARYAFKTHCPETGNLLWLRPVLYILAHVKKPADTIALRAFQKEQCVTQTRGLTSHQIAEAAG